MAYSELIKNFDKIRDYMREFYVYGFKSRDDYDSKSARSYDDVRRRIESWLGGYMSFRKTPEGKNVFISVDNRTAAHNPLFSAWKAKSFTDNDVTLHFHVLDLLAGGEGLTVREMVNAIADRLGEFNSPLELDESTIRKKLKEYEQLGLIKSKKCGRELVFSIVSDDIDLLSWTDAAAFFSEEAPCGVIGSYLLDKLDDVPDCFGFKHHYILHALDSQVMYDILLAMREKRCIDVTNFNSRRSEEHEHRVYPLKFYVSTQSGREYLLAYHYKFRKPMFFRLDGIRRVKAGPYEKNHEKYEGQAAKFDENLWGVSTGSDFSIDHVEMTVRAGAHEGYIVDRLEREKRHGRVERIDDDTYKFIADVYDAGELLPWARTFIGRVVRFESSNRFAVERFYSDVKAMKALYGGDAK